MDRRRIPEMAAYFDEIIHIVSEKTGIGGHVRAVTLAYLQFVDLQEMFVGRV
jgi:hypothetical protein